MTVSVAVGIAVLSLAIIDCGLSNVAYGQTIADTLRDEERTIGTVVFTGDQIASLERSMPAAYEALLTGQWQSYDGFEKHRIVVSQLRKHWGYKESLDSPDVVQRVQDGAMDARDVLEPVFDRASVSLLQHHIVFEQVRIASVEPLEKLRGILATASESEADSLAKCLRAAESTAHGCSHDAQITFDAGIGQCNTSPSGVTNPALEPCALLQHNMLSTGLTGCQVGFSNGYRRCLSEIDWPAGALDNR